MPYDSDESDDALHRALDRIEQTLNGPPAVSPRERAAAAMARIRGVAGRAPAPLAAPAARVAEAASRSMVEAVASAMAVAVPYASTGYLDIGAETLHVAADGARTASRVTVSFRRDSR